MPWHGRCHLEDLQHGLELSWRALEWYADSSQVLSQVGKEVVGDSVVDNGFDGANCSHDPDDGIDACH